LRIADCGLTIGAMALQAAAVVLGNQQSAIDNLQSAIAA
jgi:hypothetical protein